MLYYFKCGFTVLKCNSLFHRLCLISRTSNTISSDTCMMYEVHILQPGYSSVNSDGTMTANGTSSLVVGRDKRVIVDTLSPWDRDLVTQRLLQYDLLPRDITHVVCTHGHPDHTGNNNLFTNAQIQVVGNSIYHKDVYYEHQFADGIPYEIDGRDLYVHPTPGHTLDSVSVVVNTRHGRVCIAGDLFEKEEDIKNSKIWKEAGSEDEVQQIKNRSLMLLLSDFIIPGHGSMFSVTNQMKLDAQKSLGCVHDQMNQFGLYLPSPQKAS